MFNSSTIPAIIAELDDIIRVGKILSVHDHVY